MGLIENITALGLPEAQARRAAAALSDGTAAWIVVSGKMCSGKDTVAPLVLPRLGYTDVERVGYSDPMKAELQEIIDLVGGHDASELEALAQEVALRLGYKPHHAEEAVKMTLALVEGGVTDAWARTDENRDILQKVGTYWRTEDDEEYWSRKVALTCLELLAEGTSVYLTGGRFEPDVRIPQDMGAKIIRLDISPEVQAERMFKRDGILPDPKTINHPGEVALDDWERFDVRVTNEGTLEECLEAVTAGFRQAVNA